MFPRPVGRWICATAGLVLLAGCEGGERSTTLRLLLLHTNDLHSNLEGHGPEADYTPETTGDDDTHGGVARLAARIADERAGAGEVPVLLVDAGDFLMGTLFELLATTRSAELTEMGALGYDAVTIGNHELDWSPATLARIVSAAPQRPPLVASNLVFDATAPGDDALAALMGSAIHPKLVRTLPNGLKVGIFGLLGRGAASITPTAAPLTFEDPVTAARRLAQELRSTDGVDLVIALSHSGIGTDGQGEDADLALAVPELDVIVSGHSHVVLPQPVIVGSTLIVQAGAHGEHLGRMALRVRRGGARPTVTLESYAMLAIDDSRPGDSATEARIQTHVAAIDEQLAPLGLAYRQVLAETGVDVPDARAAENAAGDLVTDAYLAAASAAEPDDPAEVAIETTGMVRAPLQRGRTGQVWFADVFRMVPLGIGADEQFGIPLVTFFLHPKELKAGVELAATATETSGFFIEAAGLEARFDPARPIFDRVTSLRLTSRQPAVQLDPGDESSCLKVVTNAYVATMLGLVGEATAGRLSITAKEADCATAVQDIRTRILDADPAPGLQELKAWRALTSFVAAFPDTSSPPNQVPDVPSRYATGAGRVSPVSGP